MIRKVIGTGGQSDPLTRMVRLRHNAVALYGPKAFEKNERYARLRKTFGASDTRKD